MSTEFASADLTAGQLNAIVKKLGGYDGAIKFLQGKLSVSEPTRNWREQDGVIYLSVTSDGATGPLWIKRLEGKGFRLSDYAKSVLRSPDFKPTNGVTTEIAILKGMLFEGKDRITHKIRTFAAERKLSAPNAEVACLIRKNFSDEDIEAMGLIWIVTMHESINHSGGVPDLLYANRHDDGRWLNAYYDKPGFRWFRESGFAFVVSQVTQPKTKPSVSEPTRNWREQDGVIYFSVTSDGTTGEDWINRLEGNGFRVGYYAKQVLCSPDFKPTNGVTTEVAVLKGMLFEDNDRITKKIRAEADKCKLTKPNAEVACLIRENFSDEDIEAMGLIWIVTMHEPINDSDGDPHLLDVCRRGVGRWLDECCGGEPGLGCDREVGFAFVVSQVGPQN